MCAHRDAGMASIDASSYVSGPKTARLNPARTYCDPAAGQPPDATYDCLITKACLPPAVSSTAGLDSGAPAGVPSDAPTGVARGA